MKVIHPGKRLSNELLTDICNTALPTGQQQPNNPNPRNTYTSSSHQKFMYRLRDTSLPGSVFKDEHGEVIGTAVTKSTVFYNCYCSFTQSIIPPSSSIAKTSPNPQTNTDEEDKPYRQAVVIVSKWPFPHVAYRVLEKLEEGIAWNIANKNKQDQKRLMQSTSRSPHSLASSSVASPSPRRRRKKVPSEGDFDSAGEFLSGPEESYDQEDDEEEEEDQEFDWQEFPSPTTENALASILHQVAHEQMQQHGQTPSQERSMRVSQDAVRPVPWSNLPPATPNTLTASNISAAAASASSQTPGSNTSTPADVPLSIQTPGTEVGDNDPLMIMVHSSVISRKIVEKTFYIAYQQIQQWPMPFPDTVVYFHFFGEMIPYAIPADILANFVTNLTMTSLLSSVNLISLLGPLALVQHIWTIWEWLVTGQDIVVLGPNATVCSDVVLALASIISPYLPLGDVRPYLHASDPELLTLAVTSHLKHSSLVEDSDAISNYPNLKNMLARNRSMIVGICDPMALLTLEEFDCFIMISPSAAANLGPSIFSSSSPNPTHKLSIGSGTGTVMTETTAAPTGPSTRFLEVIYKGLRSHNACNFQLLPSAVPLPAASSNPSNAQKRKSVTVVQPKSVTEYFNEWVEAMASDPSGKVKKGLVLARQEPTAAAIPRILTRIKRLGSEDRPILGDQLLRDHLRELTKSYISPTVVGDTTENADNTNDSNKRLSRSESMQENPRTSMNLSSASSNLIAAKVDPNAVINTITQEQEALAQIKADERLYHIATTKGMLYLAFFEGYYAVLHIWPQWALRNVPTIILWISYLNFILFLMWLLGRTPTILWLSWLLMVTGWIKIPEQASTKFELFLQRYIPEKILYPYGKPAPKQTTQVPIVTATIVAPANKPAKEENDNDEEEEDNKPKKPRPNFTGTWQRTKSENLEALVQAIGGSYIERKLAPSIPITHIISTDETTHEEAIFIHEKAAGGLLDVRYTLTIGGNEALVNSNRKDYMQRAYWQDDKLILYRMAKDGSHDMTIIRSWTENVKQGEPDEYVVTVILKDLKNPSNPDVKVVDWYQKTGPCPSTVVAPVPDKAVLEANRAKERAARKKRERSSASAKKPASATVVNTTNVSESDNKVSADKNISNDDDEADDESGKLQKPHPNFAGTWQRTKSENLEALVQVLGGSYIERKLAPSIPITHTINTDEATHEEAIFIHEKAAGGLLDTQSTVTIGGNESPVNSNKRDYMQRAYWQDDKLVIYRLVKSGSHEMTIIRSWNYERKKGEADEYILTIHYKHLRDPSKPQVTSIDWYQKTGPCPSTVPAPVPDKAAIEANRAKERAARKKNTSEVVAASSTTTSSKIVPKLELSTIEEKPITPATSPVPSEKSESISPKPRSNSQSGVNAIPSLRSVLIGQWREIAGPYQAPTVIEPVAEKKGSSEEGLDSPRNPPLPGIYRKFVLTKSATEVETLQLSISDSVGHVQKSLSLPLTGVWVPYKDEVAAVPEQIVMQAFWEGRKGEETLLVIRSQILSSERQEVYEKYCYDHTSKQLQVFMEKKSLTNKSSEESTSTGTTVSKLSLEKVSS
jgi:hypothetical protein